MIQGQVTSRKRAVVSVTLVDPTGLLVNIEAAVDTGFTGYLTLPPDLINVMQLPYARTSSIVLGNGTSVLADTYMVTVAWEGGDRQIAALAADGIPLIGMSLLQGYHLFIDVVAGGEVRIEQRP